MSIVGEMFEEEITKVEARVLELETLIHKLQAESTKILSDEYEGILAPREAIGKFQKLFDFCPFDSVVIGK